ncbi:hypothetical protein PLICRDRAFT_567250 [Plicaturopsis crispa FD-325 SS-3]|nr:hypothetical protein PLICRDRAFT_567250 [Plicaturopsis crispa FD-325 SS-3]
MALAHVTTYMTTPCSPTRKPCSRSATVSRLSWATHPINTYSSKYSVYQCEAATGACFDLPYARNREVVPGCIPALSSCILRIICRPGCPCQWLHFSSYRTNIGTASHAGVHYSLLYLTRVFNESHMNYDHIVYLSIYQRSRAVCARASRAVQPPTPSANDVSRWSSLSLLVQLLSDLNFEAFAYTAPFSSSHCKL